MLLIKWIPPNLCYFVVLVKFHAHLSDDQKRIWKDAIGKLGNSSPQVKDMRLGHKVIIPAAAKSDAGWEDGEFPISLRKRCYKCIITT